MKDKIIFYEITYALKGDISLLPRRATFKDKDLAGRNFELINKIHNSDLVFLKFTEITKQLATKVTIKHFNKEYYESNK